jgi:hypothetical protein
MKKSELREIIREEMIGILREESLLRKLGMLLKNISDEQLDYNMKNNLPWDWNGTKEGYYEYINGTKYNSGSN